MIKEITERDKYLESLEKYIKENPSSLPQHMGEIIIPERIINKGEKMIISLISYGSYNAALTITHDCFNPESDPEQIPLQFREINGDYYAETEIAFEIAGNTRIEYWANNEKLVRQIAVLDEGYVAVIPWVGDNRPYLNEELHRFDLPGDYWMPEPELCENPEETLEKFKEYIINYRKYGDRTVPFINARTLLPSSETDTIFELPKEVQEKGIHQLLKQMEILGYEKTELIASYTPDSTTLEILEKAGVKALTSLCAWQNWQDHGWKINHCGVPNQPYYPSDDDFRRAGNKRDIMCFTMGNSNCNRNYSIMVLDSCPTNVVPGERYLTHRVVNQQLQRFYDAFDGFINDGKNNEKLLTITIALESFRGFMDWTATNEAAIRYMIKKAATEKIVFTSAADISDYYKKHNLPMQEGYFFQPDYYYGYHNGTMPGRIDDRIEADTKDYLAVIRRSSMLPMYFYDYTEPWEGCLFEDTERNEFGQVDPDEHKPSECFPKQVYTEDMELNYNLDKNILSIYVKSHTSKKRMVTGIFDIPFCKDFEITCHKKDVSFKKIHDFRTGNTHLFIDLGYIEKGESVITANISGIAREPKNPEYIKDGFGIMYFNDHAYLRSTDKEAFIKVEIPAPPAAYIRLISGRKIFAENGKLIFNVNENWENESSILYNYPEELFKNALNNAKVERKGTTTCSRWSGQ